MRALVAVAMFVSLQFMAVDVKSESPTAAPPRTPETGIDPGIQANPGPSPDPHTAVPPKNNPDPEMAINPDVTPTKPPSARRLTPPDPNSDAREPDILPKKQPDLPKR